MIDWDALDSLADRNRQWRKRCSSRTSQLGEVYVPGCGAEPTEDVAVMVIGEAPGAQEEIARKPFVGPAGQVLRQLMKSVRLHSGKSWLTNVVKFRPPGNRTPFINEIFSVRALLFDEWEAIGNPRLIIPIGGTALHAVMGNGCGGILATAGKSICYRNMCVYPMLHTAYGLRNPSAQPTIEQHWDRLDFELSNDLASFL